MGPSDCGKTCFTESLLLDHLPELFVNPPSTIHYCYGVSQDGLQDMNDAGVQFHESDSSDRPSQVVVSEGWITGIRRSDGRGR